MFVYTGDKKGFLSSAMDFVKYFKNENENVLLMPRIEIKIIT